MPAEGGTSPHVRMRPGPRDRCGQLSLPGTAGGQPCSATVTTQSDWQRTDHAAAPAPARVPTPDLTSVGRVLEGRLLVTGAAGFIGSHLVELLLAHGCAVVGLDRRPPHLDREASRNVGGLLDHPVVYGDEQTGDVSASVADLTRAGRVLGYRPRTDLCDGLRRYWHWLNDQCNEPHVSASLSISGAI
jgi:hypothetical protein